MKIKKYQKSKELLMKGLEDKPFFSLYRMNLAFNYLLAGEYETAIQEYQSVKRLKANSNLAPASKDASSQEPGTLENNNKKIPNKKEIEEFYIPFNSAVAATLKKDTDQALSFYQQALNEQPHSREVKTNIELLFQQQNQKGKKDQKPDKDQKNTSDKSPKNQSSDSKDVKNQNRSSSPGEDANPAAPRDQNQELPGSLVKNKKDSQNLNKNQVEAVLEAIQAKEKTVRQKRKKQDRQTPHRGGEKDW